MKRKTVWIILSLMIAAAFLLRLVCLLCYGMQYDDVISLGFPGMFYSLGNYSPQPTFLYAFFMNLLERAAPSGEFILRLPAVFWGTLALLPVYLFTSRLFGKQAGLIAAYLGTISPFLIGYSQEIRMYTLLFFLGAVSYFCFLIAVETGSRRAWGVNILTNSLAAYLNFAAVLTIPAQLLFLSVFYAKRCRGERAAAVRAQSVQLLLFLPWFMIFLRQWGFMLRRTQADKRIYTYLEKVTPQDIFFTFKNLIAGFYSCGWGRDILIILFGGLCVLGILRLLFPGGKIAPKEIQNALSAKEKVFLLISSFLLPMIILIVFSQFRMIYCDKYVIVCLLFLLAFAGYALSRLKPVFLLAALALITIFTGIVLKDYYRNRIYPDYRQRPGIVNRKEFRKAAAYCLSAFRPGDVILHTSGTSTLPLAYYLDRNGKRGFLNGRGMFVFAEEIYRTLGKESRLIFQDIESGAFRFNDDGIPGEEFAGSLSVYRRVWLVFSYWECQEPFQPVKEWFDRRFLLIESRAFSGVILFLYQTDIGKE